MSLTRLIKNVAKRKQQLTTGDPNNRVTLYQDALAKLGLFIFDTIRPGGLIEHHFNLRDDQGRTIELELKRESDAAITLGPVNQPDVHVYMEVYDGEFQCASTSRAKTTATRASSSIWLRQINPHARDQTRGYVVGV